jgi:hypothetical protein
MGVCHKNVEKLLDAMRKLSEMLLPFRDFQMGKGTGLIQRKVDLGG